ncbi:arylsulfatase b [Plakobranchus ocellatus]|uniref:Arylsulfatase b n=1 Tax=Plakobranchus ocellatus TaxID=259542 RepID=A0AAV4ATK7_9GAST|nr:arylsulfatase b [Plakobranchus ocellatus]
MKRSWFFLFWLRFFLADSALLNAECLAFSWRHKALRAFCVPGFQNGGWTIYGGSNYPLRGGKISIFEGGNRVPGFVHSPLLSQSESGVTYNGVIHAVDWFPTLVNAAGLSIDGLVQASDADQGPFIDLSASSDDGAAAADGIGDDGGDNAGGQQSLPGGNEDARLLYYLKSTCNANPSSRLT